MESTQMLRLLNRIWWGSVSVMLLTGAYSTLPFHWNYTDSLPWGLYRETHEPITRGVLVWECLPENLATLGWQRGWLGRGMCPTRTTPVLKQVAAVEGDIVRLTNAFVEINGEILLNTQTLWLDSNGREIPRVPRGTFTLQPGQALLLGISQTSWDGRYYGPSDLANVRGTAPVSYTHLTL